MHALISGAGIAGTVTAMALQRAGIEATVFEAHGPADGDVGSYLTIAPNGLDALDAVGVMHLAVAAGRPTRRNVLWNGSGRQVGVAGLGAPLPDGTVAQTMKRARLTRVLAEEAARRGIPIRYGRRLVGATVAAGGAVTARFADGSEATGDVLIGADGIHSVVRRLLDPGAPSGRFVGLTNFGGVTRSPGLTVPDEWHMIFGRKAFFGYGPGPDGAAVWFVNWPRPEISRGERATTSPEQWKQQLVELFAGDAGPAEGLIRSGELELAGDSTYDLPHVPVWHRGPVVIIGDAAHAPSPTSGQGASMAAEDGVLLAKALRDLPTVPAALAAYEDLRRERVERIVAFGARGSSAKVPGRIGRVVRDAMLRVVFRWFVTDRSMAWLFDYRIDWDSPVPAGDGRATGPAPAPSRGA